MVNQKTKHLNCIAKSYEDNFIISKRKVKQRHIYLTQFNDMGYTLNDFIIKALKDKYNTEYNTE